jgi:tRNA (cmo5U34)-methyltransferase
MGREPVPRGQFHEDPGGYLSGIRSEVPRYDDLQDAVAEAASLLAPQRILDLGVGTGETARRLLQSFPAATVVGVDASAGMLELASQSIPRAELIVGRLEDPLPQGDFDTVVSALAVHHLSPSGKADLFRRVADALRPGGRFVLGDVVVPEDPRDAVTQLDPHVDRPDALIDQLAWLGDAGLPAQLVWRADDLVVVAADKPG